MKIILMLLVAIGLVGCGGSTSKPSHDGDLALSTEAVRIDTPFRTSAFEYEDRFKLTIIDSQAGLDKWAERVGEGQSSAFWADVSTADIDYDNYNLVVYFMAENSGSIVVKPQAPQIVDRSIHINIVRIVPNGGTADIGEYILAYKVNKSITHLYFDNGDDEAQFANVAGEQVKPTNCQELSYCKDRPVVVAAVELIDIPLREHGYSNFNTTVISTKKQFDDFLKAVDSQDNWNDKSGFVKVLSNTEIDFDQHNVMLYRHTEGSGSIDVRVGGASVKGDWLSIKVLREVPDGGTDDMAYYTFAYKVKKTITSVEFSFSERESPRIANISGENIEPLNCKAWNDGCNDCMRGEGGSIGCTKKFCDAHDTLYCTEWD